MLKCNCSVLLAILQVLNIPLQLMAIILESANIAHFHQRKTFSTRLGFPSSIVIKTEAKKECL